MKEFLFHSRILRFLYWLIGIVIVIIIMDQFVMPWYVNLGDEIEMPDVVELSINDAQQALQKQGFHVVLADSVYDSAYPLGTVVEQMPVAASTVKVGRNVYLTISNGEKPIVMPNLFSKSPQEAKLRIKQMGLQLNTILYAYSDLYPAGAVIGQSFPQGQKVKRNTLITITVSLGEMPSKRQMPDLIGKSLNAAKQQLRQLNIPVEDISYEENEKFLPNTVLKQQPVAGSLLKESKPVKLTVSKIPDEAGNP